MKKYLILAVAYNKTYTLKLTDKNTFVCNTFNLKSLSNQEDTYSIEEAIKIMKKFHQRKRKNPSNHFFNKSIQKIQLLKLNTLIEVNKQKLIKFHKEYKWKTVILGSLR